MHRCVMSASCGRIRRVRCEPENFYTFVQHNDAGKRAFRVTGGGALAAEFVGVPALAGIVCRLKAGLQRKPLTCFQRPPVFNHARTRTEKFSGSVRTMPAERANSGTVRTADPTNLATRYAKHV